MSDRSAVDVYFDFACPYVHSAAVWLREVNRQLGDNRIDVTWKFFPLEEVNAPPDADTPIWDLPADRRSRGRDSFHAAAAARRQGREAFERFHAELLTLKHEEGQDHGKRSTLDEAAVRARLDLDALRGRPRRQRAACGDQERLHRRQRRAWRIRHADVCLSQWPIGLPADSASTSSGRGGGILAGLCKGRTRPAVSA